LLARKNSSARASTVALTMIPSRGPDPGPDGGRGEIERIDPARIVIDSLSEMRLLAQSPLRYRRQVFALKHFLGARHATVLMIDDLTSESHEFQLRSCTASSLCRSWRSTMAQSGDGCA
jgi:hypothetical protein